MGQACKTWFVACWAFTVGVGRLQDQSVESKARDAAFQRTLLDQDLMGITTISPVDPMQALWKLHFMQGEWSGSGLIEAESDYRIEFRQTESIGEISSATYLLQSSGFRITRHLGSNIGHEFRKSLISYEGQKKVFRLRCYMENGMVLDAEAPFAAGKIRWVMEGDSHKMGELIRSFHRELPRVRYTIEVSSAGTWYERGETLGKDKRWSKFYEITLKQVSPGATSSSDRH